MTVLDRHIRSRSAIPAAAIAVLLLAGCTSGHVGEDWQCPLATGGSCDSVAMADPAVPKPASVQRSAPGEPIRLLPLETGPTGADAPPMETRSCEVACDGFDPFGWLERLFGAEVDESDKRPAAPEPAALPVEEIQPEAGPVGDDDVDVADLRTDETVARIWIAPFVDADGIYREAAHVRVVLEPAGWRLR